VDNKRNKSMPSNDPVESDSWMSREARAEKSKSRPKSQPTANLTFSK